MCVSMLTYINSFGPDTSNIMFFVIIVYTYYQFIKTLLYKSP